MERPRIHFSSSLIFQPRGMLWQADDDVEANEIWRSCHSSTDIWPIIIMIDEWPGPNILWSDEMVISIFHFESFSGAIIFIHSCVDVKEEDLWRDGKASISANLLTHYICLPLPPPSFPHLISSHGFDHRHCLMLVLDDDNVVGSSRTILFCCRTTQCYAASDRVPARAVSRPLKGEVFMMRMIVIHTIISSRCIEV